MPATRTPFVGGNWKMNLTRAGAEALARDVAAGADPACGVDIAVFPPFVHLETVSRVFRGGAILGGQDLYYEASGAFTGEISAGMLLDIGATAVLTGHSERRHVIGESDELVGQKTASAIAAGLTAVLCIGEKLEEREAGQTDAVNERQLRAGLKQTLDAGVQALHTKVVIAYEPVWAIGTGKTATAADAQAAHARIREVLAELIGTDSANHTRILYGGSMKPANAPELMSQADIDGGLIGGASLSAPDFLAIIAAAKAPAAATN